jgi:hypothetical protein
MSDLPTKHEGDGSKRDIDDVIAYIIGGHTPGGAGTSTMTKREEAWRRPSPPRRSEVGRKGMGL